MAMVTSTSPNTTDLSQSLSLENRNNLRDASFSSYLNGAEETFFLLKLTESTQTTPSSLLSTPQHDRVYVGKKKAEEGEIGVFSAEKYFQGAMDEENPRIATTKHQNEKDEPIDKPKTQPATPSVRSESSWNSQRSLLHTVPRKQPRRRTNMVKSQGKNLLANLGCNCYCNDKKSVDIDDYHFVENCGAKEITKQHTRNGNLAQSNKSMSKTCAMEEMHSKKFDEPGFGLKREDCFSFPILNSKTIEVQLQEEIDDTKRISLEVFGSPILEKGKKQSLSLDRKLTMLNWDAVEETETVASYNDNESDASSDLFEIESFSTTNANPFLSRQASDGMSMSSCVTPTTCYAPSEASIEWSVATASAADFSMISDFEELKNPSRLVRNAKTSPGKEAQKRRPGILLGCKSHKAVSVAGDVYRKNEREIPYQRGGHKLDSFKPVTRFQADTKLTGFDSRRGQHASHLLYIQ